MQERLIIKNFGPIKSVDLKLGKITILIGEQASGKSTVAKVLAVCRYFSFIIDYKILKNFDGPFIEGLRFWGLSEYIKSDSYINYENEDYFFELELEERIVQDTDSNGLPLYSESIGTYFIPKVTPKSERFKKVIEELEGLKLKENKEYGYVDFDWIPDNSFFRNSVKNVMDNPFYIPTERGLSSLFSLGKGGIQNMIDALYEQFALMDKISKSFEREIIIDPLNIYFVNRNGKSLIQKVNDKDFYSLSNGASGYQSTIPIVLAIKYYSTIVKRKRTFIIEEPEQNLFPVAQKSLVEFLTESVNTFGHKLLITTHSPYILTSLENLMYADKLGQINDLKLQINNLIDQKYWINQKDVQVYYLDKEKEIDLMDREFALIKKDKLDSVSEIINDVFDELLKIENDFEKE
jgi:predicted ATPase